MNEEKQISLSGNSQELEPKPPKPKKAKKKKKKKSGWFTNLLLGLILLVGVGIMAYPTFSNWWNQQTASRAIATYIDAVDSLDEAQRAAILEAARTYNARLAGVGIHFMMSEAEIAEYYSLLDITGTGIMGYIQIPAINVNLPVYHGTDEAVLQIAAGHLQGTSLPVGGTSTHTAISGHRGLPSARLFTDLDRLQEGDVFVISVYGEEMVYMIDQIRVVLPQEVDSLSIEAGADQCTLITCTPYGVNTHRMLVRGSRIADLPDDVTVVAEAFRMPAYYVVMGVGIPLLFVILLALLIYYRTRKPGPTYRQILDEISGLPSAEPEPKPRGRRIRRRKGPKA